MNQTAHHSSHRSMEPINLSQKMLKSAHCGLLRVTVRVTHLASWPRCPCCARKSERATNEDASELMTNLKQNGCRLQPNVVGDGTLRDCHPRESHGNEMESNLVLVPDAS